MQFNHPEILALLFVLIIPILIHLFQLQRFKKEAFTNVKFLRQIELESRKSSRIKKWLILAMRMLAFTCLILAFAQPVIKKSSGQKNRKTIVYLDNSLSMQAKDQNGSESLQNAKRLLIDELQVIQGDFALITNNNIWENLQSEDIRQELTKIDYNPVRKDFSQILLEAEILANKNEIEGADVFIFSDFRNTDYTIDTLLPGNKSQYYLIPIRPDPFRNLCLDSLWISTPNRKELKISGRVLSQNTEEDNLSVSLVLNGQLFGKTSLSINEDEQAEVEFSIPKETSGNGAMIFTDPRLGFDNSLFFTLPPSIKPKVLVIGAHSGYLQRIYTEDSFDLDFQELSNLNQGRIEQYDLILLNELAKIPAPLAGSLKGYVEQIGNLVIIPSAQPDLASYQSAFTTWGIGRISSEFERPKTIIRVSENHPFFNNVFKGEVKNFDYPVSTYGIESDFRSSSPLINFEDGSAFASEIPMGSNRVFWIASPLNGDLCDFRDSPLIVPLFYNFSLPENRTEGAYSIIGKSSEVSIRNDNLSGNALKITDGNEEYIPLQKNMTQGVQLFVKDYPTLPGIFKVVDQDRTLQELAFNYDRDLIRYDFTDLKNFAASNDRFTIMPSPEDGLRTLNELYSSRSLWQLFTIFALIFLVLEMLIQKFFKP